MALADQYDVVLNGRGYSIDTDSQAYKHNSVPMVRQQSDTSNKPGEQSLNPAGLWRRSQESWHHGAGQDWLDRDGADPYRFDTSKGVDVWDKWALGLLPDVTEIGGTAATNQYLATSGGRMYHTDAQAVKVSGVGNSTFSTATGTPAADATAIASDGTTCYVGYGASGIYSATGTVFASFATGTVDLVRFARGRLMAAAGPNLYNVIAAGALPGALFTHANASWLWTDIGEGAGFIYAAGYVGDKSTIYKTAVKADATGLDIPVSAAVLPDGEIARSITGYLGYVVIGTDLGLRFAVADADGFLTLGALIETTNPVLCAESQGKYVWYGLTNYDGSSTGLGRLDLSTFTSDLTPAYASDLLTGGQGEVRGVVTYLDKRWFTVSGQGMFAQSASKVASGTITLSKITYGLPDSKTLLSVAVNIAPFVGTASINVTVNAVDIGTASLGGASRYVFDTDMPVVAESADPTLTLTGPSNHTVRRVTFLADPVPDRTQLIQVPILLADISDDPDVVAERPVDVDLEWGAIYDLWTSRQVVTYQRRGRSWQVVVDDFTWVPMGRSARPEGENGTLLVVLKVVS